MKELFTNENDYRYNLWSYRGYLVDHCGSQGIETNISK